MIRHLVKAVALWHDRRTIRLGAGLRDNHRRIHRKWLRRTRRVSGCFPWWGLGWLWRWLYVPYDKHCEQKHAEFLSRLSPCEYVRYKINEEGFRRRIVPPSPIPDAELDRRTEVP